MATKQTDGVSNTTKQSTKNNSGVMVANTVSQGIVQGGLFSTVRSSRVDVGVFASTVINNNSADPAILSGVFAYNNNKPVAKKTTTKINVIANNFLRSGALVPSLIKSVKKQLVNKDNELVEGVRTSRQTLAIRNGKFDIYTGKFDTGFPVVVADELPSDREANVSRVSPAGLAYKTGAKNPTVGIYKGKTG